MEQTQLAFFLPRFEYLNCPPITRQENALKFITVHCFQILFTSLQNFISDVCKRSCRNKEIVVTRRLGNFSCFTRPAF